jgi:hypothetical protein
MRIFQKTQETFDRACSQVEWNASDIFEQVLLHLPCTEWWENFWDHFKE